MVTQSGWPGVCSPNGLKLILKGLVHEQLPNVFVSVCQCLEIVFVEREKAFRTG